jgi:trehalose synthase
MGRLEQVRVDTLDPARLELLIGPDRAARFEQTAERARMLLTGRRVLNVNSTAKGGGVAELLQNLLAYGRGVGIDAQWWVIQGDPAFFAITKRVHNMIYGVRGDDGPLGEAEHRVYETVLAANADELGSVIRPGDVVVLHDPQTAGLAGEMRRAGATVVWRCHIGRDTPNAYTERGWEFLARYLGDNAVDAFVFSRRVFAPKWIAPEHLHVIQPSIDPFSTKNEELSPDLVRQILVYTGLLAGDATAPDTTFSRRDGSPCRVDHRVDILQTGPPPPPNAPLVVQASRWDRIKDPAGVMHGFAEYVDGVTPAHLALVGPAVHGVTDDPEAADVLDECVEVWQALPHAVRSRVHLVCVPMHDPDEAAIIVNALQRHATVVVQKSLAEGFALTVSEAMWKTRPVVGSRVGGIADQIIDGETGLLINDPHDLEAFGSAVHRLLDEPSFASRLGKAGHNRAYTEFLQDRHLEQYAALFATLEHAR